MIQNVVRGNGSRICLVLVAVASLGVGWWLREEISSRTQSANADVVACKELVRTFDAYPLVYLGDSFEGLPLNYCLRRRSDGQPGLKPATDRFVFVYGQCTIESGESSCPALLQVTIYPPCSPAFLTAGAEMIRGSDAKGVGAGGVLVETPAYWVKISSGTGDAPLAQRAFLELRGANPLAAELTVSKPLAEPALVDAPATENDAAPPAH